MQCKQGVICSNLSRQYTFPHIFLQDEDFLYKDLVGRYTHIIEKAESFQGIQGSWVPNQCHPKLSVTLSVASCICLFALVHRHFKWFQMSLFNTCFKKDSSCCKPNLINYVASLYSNHSMLERSNPTNVICNKNQTQTWHW